MKGKCDLLKGVQIDMKNNGLVQVSCNIFWYNLSLVKVWWIVYKRIWILAGMTDDAKYIKLKMKVAKENDSILFLKVFIKSNLPYWDECQPTRIAKKVWNQDDKMSRDDE